MCVPEVGRRIAYNECSKAVIEPKLGSASAHKPQAIVTTLEQHETEVGGSSKQVYGQYTSVIQTKGTYTEPHSVKCALWSS